MQVTRNQTERPRGALLQLDIEPVLVVFEDKWETVR